MSNRAIGFDRDIKIEWLDAVATEVAKSQPAEAVRLHIKQMLGTTLAKAALVKTTTVLLHIWSQVPDRCVPLRNRISSIFPELAVEERLAAHWSLSLATYPFFFDVAASIGRLLALQGDVQIATVRRRLAEKWGDRSTMPQAARKVVRTMVSWGALVDLKPGIYAAPPSKLSPGLRATEYLVESLLLKGNERSVSLSEIDKHPALFPFRIGVLAHHLRSAKQFNVHREGFDAEIVELSKA